MVIFSILFFAGCATQAKYKKVLDTWVGSSELDLIRSWGAPVNTYEAAGRKFIMYSSSYNVALPGNNPTYTTNVIGNTAYTNSYGGTPGQNLLMICETTFEVEEGIIVKWSYRGNDCTTF